jgi:hypothetical protein
MHAAKLNFSTRTTAAPVDVGVRYSLLSGSGINSSLDWSQDRM